MQEKTTLTVSVPKSLKSRLEALAAREQRPLSNFVRLLLQEIVPPAKGSKKVGQ
jgi:mRNA-degrading endonuclease RelE of RelBE toxin-antitoxin system